MKKEVDSIGSPGGDASAKKVLVFGPDGTVESKCGSDHGPICDISHPNALLGFFFVGLVLQQWDRGDDGG